MAITAAVVSAGDDILATQHNTIVADLTAGNTADATRYFDVPLSTIRGVDAAADATVEIISLASEAYMVNNDGTFAQRIYAVTPPHIPEGCVVTGFQLGFKRDDAVATLSATLIRFTRSDNTQVDMAGISASDSSGALTLENDVVIENATIDTSLYRYLIYLAIDNNNATTDVKVYSMKITVLASKNLV